MNDADVLAARGPKAIVDPWKPYAFLVEPERSAAGVVEDVATIFLTNKECTFRCVFCDLWKHTLDEPTPLGAIPAQIDYALARLLPAQHVKLYNSGNFFDAQAIPPADWPAIADRVRHFGRVIVENHPRLVSERCLRFRDLLPDSAFEIAMGLETAEAETLAQLNKQMTLRDFARAADFLTERRIDVRTFILLPPPFLSLPKAVESAIRSLKFAFECGASVVSVILTRGGHGDGRPTLGMLEEVLEAGIELQRGRVFADLWGADTFATCNRCCQQRIERLRSMNLTQSITPRIACECQTA